MTLLTQFQSAQPILVALGDPSRQAIISAMLENGCDTGMRVGDLTQAVALSRPAVSHHLKILRDAQLVRMEKVGSKRLYPTGCHATLTRCLKGGATCLI